MKIAAIWSRRVGVPLLLLSFAVATAARAQGMFYAEERRDGQIYVFNSKANWEHFKATGEPGAGLTRPGAGPAGENVFADNETALELFFFKYGIPEVVERPKAPVNKVEWRDGKTRFTLGGNFYMELGNKVQVRFTGEFPDDSVKLPGTENPGDARGSFRIRRAKTKLAGWFYEEWLEYELQVNWPNAGGSNPGALLEDANINWDLSKGGRRFMIKFGQYKVPFGQQELTSSNSQQFVDRVLAASEYFRGRDRGLQLWGQFANKLEYRAGIFDGNGVTRSTNDNNKFQYDLRLRWQPNGAVPLGDESGPLNSESDFESRRVGRPLFAIGASFESQSTRNVNADPTRNLDSDLWNFDVVFKHRGLFATAEYVVGRRRPQQGAVYDTSGWFVQGGYFLKPGTWEIAARYARVDPSDLVALDRATELGGALNYFYNKHALKVQADFRRIRTESASGATRNYEFRLQTQFAF